MNYLMYQNGDCQSESPKVPDGLKELMSDISREVLREQPENIYEFIADYLEEMEIARERRGVAVNLLNTVIDESITVYELFKENMSLDQAKKCAQIIDKCFYEYARNKNMKKKYNEKSAKLVERDICRKIIQCCDLTREQDQKLRKIVQTCFKNFYFREQSCPFKNFRLPDSNLAKRAEKTLDIYRQATPEKPRLEEAAVVIQSAYRSYFVRKMPKELQRFHECATKIQARFRAYIVQKELKRANAAAVKIQAMYRGHSTRKMLVKQRETAKIIGMIDYAPYLLASDLVNEIVSSSITDEKKKFATGIKDVRFGDDVIWESSSKEEMAARTIQKTFRGFQKRKKNIAKTNIESLDQRFRCDRSFERMTIEKEINNMIESMQDEIEFKQST